MRFAPLGFALLLGSALPGLGDDVVPGKSILLVARKDLPDPNFRDTVVLVTRQGARGPVGVIINRPTDVLLSSLFSDFEKLRASGEKLYFGGPVSRSQITLVFRSDAPPDAVIEVLEGVYMGSNKEVLRELLGRDHPLEGLRVFAGHAGWAPGQLEAEIARGDWHVARADARTIFERKPEGLWKDLERRASATMVRMAPPNGLPEKRSYVQAAPAFREKDPPWESSAESWTSFADTPLHPRLPVLSRDSSKRRRPRRPPHRSRSSM